MLNQPLRVVRRQALLLGLAAVAALALTGCGDQSTTTTTTGSYKVGVLLQLSGLGSVYAENAQAGTKAAVADVNARKVAGATLTTDVADAGGDAQSASTACTRLIQKDRVKALVVFVPGPQLIACNTLAARSGIPVLSLSSGAGTICAPNLVSLGLVPNQQSLPVIDYLVNQGKKRWYFFGADYATPKATIGIAKPHLASIGGTVVGESYEPQGTSDYSQDITRIVNAHPDVAFLNVVGNDDVALQKQWAADPRTKGIERVDILLGEGPARALGAAGAGIWSANLYFSSIEGAGNDKFKAAVKAAGLSAAPDINTYVSYMQIEMLAQAVKAGGGTGSAVITALTTASVAGPVGTLAIRDAFSFQPVYLAQDGPDGAFTIAKKTDPTPPQVACAKKS